MDIVYNSPFSKKDLNRYALSKTVIEAWIHNFTPVLERILNENLPHWKELNGSITLKATKSTGNVKVSYDQILDPKTRTLVKNTIEDNMPNFF